MVFEAAGFARKFLVDRVKAMRYAALAYKELPRWTVPIGEAETNNLYGNLNSLRKVVAQCHPWRGTAENWNIKDEDLHGPHFKTIRPIVAEIRKVSVVKRISRKLSISPSLHYHHCIHILLISTPLFLSTLGESGR